MPTFVELVNRISWVMVPPGGSTEPEGDSICSVKLFGTAAWNKYCSSVFSELFVANMITRQQPSPTLLLGTSVIFNPFLSKAVILTPPFGLFVVLPVRSSNRLLLRILPLVGDIGDNVVGSIDRILLPFVLFRLSVAATVDGVIVVIGSLPRPPSKSSKS